MTNWGNFHPCQHFNFQRFLFNISETLSFINKDEFLIMAWIKGQANWTREISPLNLCPRPAALSVWRLLSGKLFAGLMVSILWPWEEFQAPHLAVSFHWNELSMCWFGEFPSSWPLLGGYYPGKTRYVWVGCWLRGESAWANMKIRVQIPQKHADMLGGRGGLPEIHTSEGRERSFRTY